MIKIETNQDPNRCGCHIDFSNKNGTAIEVFQAIAFLNKFLESIGVKKRHIRKMTKLMESNIDFDEEEKDVRDNEE